MEIKDGIKAFHAGSRQAWREWLRKNHKKENAVWLIIYRKTSGTQSVYYPEAVEEALCFGWIDSKGNKRDSQSYYLYFTRRNPKSKWSRINKLSIERLTAQGLMAPAGIELVDIAKKNGTWNALEEIDQMKIPEDLQRLFDQHTAAAENWAKFPPSSKKGILEWIMNAKKPETRHKRVEETVRLASDNIKANQYKKK